MNFNQTGDLHNLIYLIFTCIAKYVYNELYFYPILFLYSLGTKEKMVLFQLLCLIFQIKLFSKHLWLFYSNNAAITRTLMYQHIQFV